MKIQLMVAAALGSASTMASAIELTDFTDPNTAFDEAYVDFIADAKSGNQDQLSYNALLSGFYNKRNSTAQRVLGLRVDGNYTASRGPDEGEVLVNGETVELGDSVDDFAFSVTGQRDAYFSQSNDKLFYFTSGTYAHRDSAEDDNIGVSVGLGYGRVWNSTPLAVALRIQEVLFDRGFLSAQMSDESLLALGAIIGREDEYRANAGVDEYRGPWYADMEQVLIESGVLNGEVLSALATVEIDQVIFDEPISARRHGWLVRGGAGFQFSDFQGISDNDPKLTFQLEYAKPYGLRGQLINLATYEPIFGDNTVQSFTNLLSYTYEVSDRIDWANSWEINFQDSDARGASSFTTHVLRSSLLYELSTDLDMTFTVTATESDALDDVTTTANLGLRYRVK